MSARFPTESEAFQRYLAEQLANGGRTRSPEELLRAWRSEQQRRSGSPDRKAKPRRASKPHAPTARRESELGKTLRRIRARYIAKGGKLLSIDEIDREVEDRRGERQGYGNTV